MTIQAEYAKQIFLNAAEIASEDVRRDYVEAKCADDAELRGEVQSLLQHHSLLSSFLEPPAGGLADTLDTCPITEGPGDRISSYELLREIGEGGMGVVYAAEQKEPHRKVALKIIKPGMDTREVMARFQAEEQALAMMDHPNIARVHDAGATDTGRPYFVMELVDGVPITDYCDEHNLTTTERLKLFLSVCKAVQHAHQKGIIHRDIKPSNLLVTLQDGQPAPKIIDFGIAKAMHQPLTAGTLQTRYGQLIGTPLYMSPEQAGGDGLDIDTRSDIYSLGVVLYELLTGTTPFDRQRLQEAGVEELHQILCEEEPPRPSMRISTLAAEQSTTISQHRGVDPRRLRKLVEGDLDWIVMKALEKDRSRRYETASDLAQDIQRYLNDEAVEACPPSKMYRFGKFARRNRAALITATVLLLTSAVALVAVTLVALSQRQLADHQRELADQRLQVQQGINNALAEVARLRGQADTAEHDSELALAEARDQAQRALALAEAGPVDPQLVAQVRQLSAEMDQQQRERQLLAALDRAWLAQANMVDTWFSASASIPLLREALQVYGIDAGETPPKQCAATITASSEVVQRELLAVLHELHSMLARPLRGIYLRKPAHEAVVHSVLPSSTPAGAARLRAGDRIVGFSPRLDGLFVDTSRMPAGEVQNLMASATTVARLKVITKDRTEPRVYEFSRDPNSIWLEAVLHVADGDTWRQRVREAYRVDDVAKRRAALEKLADEADLDRQPVRVVATLARKLRHPDSVERAESLLRRVWQKQPNDVGVNLELALLLSRSDPPRLEESARYYTAAIALRPDSYGLHINLGNVLSDQGKLEEAIAEYRAALRIQPDLAIACHNLAAVLQKQGNFDQAAAACREALRLQPDDALAGSHEEALTAHRTALEIRKKLVAENPHDAHYRNDLAESYRKLSSLQEESGNSTAAWESLHEAVRLAKKLVDQHPAVGEYRSVLAWTYNNLGMLQRARGKQDEALTSCRMATGIWEKLVAENPEILDFRHGLAGAYNNLVPLQSDSGKHDEAFTSLQRANDIWKELAAEDPDVLDYQHSLAGSYNNLARLQRTRGDTDEALTSCRKALEIQEKLATENPHVYQFQVNLARSYGRLSSLQRATGNTDKALASCQQAIDIEEKLAAANPEVLDYQVALAASYDHLGQLQRATGNTDEALASCQRAIDIKEKLATANPEIPAYQHGLAGAYHNLGLLQSNTGKQDEALTSYQKAIEISGIIAAEHPAVPIYRAWLANHYNNLGLLQKTTGNTDEALTWYQKALEIREKLATENSSVVEYQATLAGSYVNVGILQKTTGNTDEALTWYQKALDIRKKLADENPEIHDYQHGLAGAYGNLGILQRAIGKPDQALVSYEKAIAVSKKLVAANPEIPAYQHGLAGDYNNLGLLQSYTGKQDEALTSYQKAIEISGIIAAENPAVPKYRYWLAIHYLNLGIVQRGTRRLDEALTSYQKAIEISEKLVATSPTVLDYQATLAQGWTELGSLRRDTGQRDEASKSFKTATDLLKKLVIEDPATQWYRHLLARVDLERGDLQTVAEELADAMVSYEQAVDAWLTIPKQARTVNQWEGLGEALYRVGRWEESCEALETVIEMRGEDAPTLAGGPRWWFLTMNLAHLGEEDKARSYYDQLVKEMGSSRVTSQQHERLRAEAAKLLGTERTERTERTKKKPKEQMNTEADAKQKAPTGAVETS